MLWRNSIAFLQKKVFDFISCESTANLYSCEPTFFTRNRILGFNSVAISILHLFKESVEFNISTFLPLLNIPKVSGAAFSKARYKIALPFFKALNGMLIEHYQRSEGKKLWKGFQLIAGDGSTVSLPPSKQMKDYFGIYASTESGTNSCLAQTFMLFDVYSNMVLESRFSPMAKSEKSLFKEIMDTYPKSKAIFLLDRGFGYFNICKKLLQQGRHFCIRVDPSNSFFGKSAMNNPSNDFVADWIPSDREKITCVKNLQDKEPIKVRVSKIRLHSGEIELLVSSLYDMEAYTTKDIGMLYNLRWAIEEGFKKLKPKMRLEHFGARKPMGVMQEFEAHIFMMNITALIGLAAQEKIEKSCNKRKLEYKYNWQNAHRFIRAEMHKLLYTNRHIATFLEKLIQTIAASVVAIKKGRNFPRNQFRKNKARQHQCYK